MKNKNLFFELFFKNEEYAPIYVKYPRDRPIDLDSILYYVRDTQVSSEDCQDIVRFEEITGVDYILYILQNSNLQQDKLRNDWGLY